MDHRTRNLWLGPAVGLLLAAAAAAGPATDEQQSAARDTLRAKGLAAVGSVWIIATEVELRRQLETLDGLERRFHAARQQADAMLTRNETIRQQLVRLEEAQKKASGDAPRPATTGTKSAGSGVSVAAPKPDGKPALSSKMPDVTGVGDETPLERAMIELAGARTALTLAAVTIRRQSERLDRDYGPLSQDAEVAAALAQLGSKARLGPLKEYDHKQPRLVAAAKAVLTTQLPVYRESGRYWISTIVNEQMPASFAIAAPDQPTLVSANLAQALNLTVDASAAQKEYAAGGRKLRVRSAKIAAIRLGKQVLRDVTVWVLPPEGEDLQSQLGDALVNCKVRLDEPRMAVVIEPGADGAGDDAQAHHEK